MKRALIALSFLSAAGCVESSAPGVRYPFRLVTGSCDGVSPLEEVTHLRFLLTGEGLAPVERLLAVGDPRPSDYIILPGRGRSVEVIGFRGDPAAGGQAISAGRTTPFEVPAKVSTGSQALELTVILRRVGAFVPTCSVATGTSSPMRVSRAGHTATLLPDGRVYIVGGYQQSAAGRMALSAAEFYEPSTGMFAVAPELGVKVGSTSWEPVFMPLPRAFHTATSLGNGQVLLWMGEEYLAGGNQPQVLATVLVFDVSQGVYAGVPFGNLNNIARSHHAAAALSSGQVVIVGGVTRGEVVAEKVEWYDPPSARARLVDGMSLPRKDMSVQALQDGSLIAVAGGSDGAALAADVELFRFDRGLGAVVRASLSSPLRLREGRRSAAQATLSESNDMVLLGGFTDPSAIAPAASSERLSTTDPPTVSDGPALTQARGDACATVLGDGRVLVIGGRTVDGPGESPRSDATVDLLTPQTGGAVTVLGGPPLRVGRYHHTCTRLADGSVLVLGGVRAANGTFEVLGDALIYTPAPAS